MRCCVAKGRGHKGRLQLHPCAQPIQNRAAKKITTEFTTPDNLTQQSTTTLKNHLIKFACMLKQTFSAAFPRLCMGHP